MTLVGQRTEECLNALLHEYPSASFCRMCFVDCAAADPCTPSVPMLPHKPQEESHNFEREVGVSVTGAGEMACAATGVGLRDGVDSSNLTADQVLAIGEVCRFLISPLGNNASRDICSARFCIFCGRLSLHGTNIALQQGGVTKLRSSCSLIHQGTFNGMYVQPRASQFASGDNAHRGDVSDIDEVRQSH